MNEWIAPLVGGVFTLITASIAAVVAIRNRRSGAKEQRAPDVNEAWIAADSARARMRLMEHFYYTLQGIAINLVRRIREAHPTFFISTTEEDIINRPPPPAD